MDDAPTASIIGPDACFRQIEFVGILKGTQNRALAEKFVDYMLGKEFQEGMALQMFVYPVNPNAGLPDEFLKYAQAPEQPAMLAPEMIASQRDRWIQSWTEVVLKSSGPSLPGIIPSILIGTFLIVLACFIIYRLYKRETSR